jgi:hypothetical protein
MSRDKTEYPCRVINEQYKDKNECPFISTYFAKNNKAKYGHICVVHYKHMTDIEKKDYELG